MFRLGGWYRRLPRIDPSTGKPPNQGSQRPADIDTTIWAGVGPLAQAREKACREAEDIGEGPPAIPPSILAKLSDEQKSQVAESLKRAKEMTEKYVQSLAEADAAAESAGLEAASSSGGTSAITAAVTRSADDVHRAAESRKPTLALAAHLAAWPEGEDAQRALIQWCVDEGVPAPQPLLEKHRQKRNDSEVIGFGMVTRPIPPNSAEWNSTAGQAAIIEEVTSHQKRGTWDVSQVEMM